MHQNRTDLAIESHSLLETKESSEGIELTKHNEGEIEITEVKIINEHGASLMGKAQGVYKTAAMSGSMLGSDWIMPAAKVLAQLLRPLLPAGGDVLVVGLGNRAITPDRLGPLAVESVIVTRHLIEAMPEQFGQMRSVCAIASGVLAETGVETADIVRGVCAMVNPAAIVAIDALAAQDPSRLCSTFQINDTGIAPGSGAYNARRELSKQSLGVPVVAIGVPTVVDGGSLLAEYTSEKAPKELREMLVTPKDIDALTTKCAKTIGFAINLALQGDMPLTEMEQYLA